MSVHAYCAPSAFERWSRCPGAPALEEHEPKKSSEYALEGLRAHEMAAHILHNVAAPYRDDAEMVKNVSKYTDAVKARVESYKSAGAKVQLFVEVSLDISLITTEQGAQGTADAIIIAEFPEGYSVLDIHDLKYGRGVEVEVTQNGQLMIYGLAAYFKYRLLHDFREFNFIIHQPRIREAPSEWKCELDELLAFGQRVQDTAKLCLHLRNKEEALDHLVPGEAQCRFCAVKYRCPALANHVQQEVFGDFQDLDADIAPVPLVPADRFTGAQLPAALARAMRVVPLVEQWCLDIRAGVDRLLNQGVKVPGFKLVVGRKGNRKWTDVAAIEALLKAEAPDVKVHTQPELLSPAQLEQVLGERPVWQTLAADFIRQADGKPSVAPEDDDRPEYTPNTIEDFESHDGSDLV